MEQNDIYGRTQETGKAFRLDKECLLVRLMRLIELFAPFLRDSSVRTGLCAANEDWVR